MDASAGLIIMAVLAGLLCLRRRRCPEPTAEERRDQMAVLMQCEVERKSQV
jgi:hypothetical protein